MLAAVLAVFGCQAVCRKYLSPNMGQLALAATFLVVYLAGARWIERRSVRELAPRRALPEISSGLALGFVLFSAVMAILWAMGVYIHGSRHRGTDQWAGDGHSVRHPGGITVSRNPLSLELAHRRHMGCVAVYLGAVWAGTLRQPRCHVGEFAIHHAGSRRPAGRSLCRNRAALAADRMHMGWNFTEGSFLACRSQASAPTRDGCGVRSAARAC